MRKRFLSILIIFLLCLLMLGISACSEGNTVTYQNEEAYNHFSTVIDELNSVVAFNYEISASGTYKSQPTENFESVIAKNISSHNFQYSEESNLINAEGLTTVYRKVYYRNGKIFLYNNQNVLTSYDADKETLGVYDVDVNKPAGFSITFDQIKSISYENREYTFTLKTAGNLVELYDVLGINLAPFNIYEPREIQGVENHITVNVHLTASNVIDSISFHLIGQEVNDRFDIDYNLSFLSFSATLSDKNFPDEISTAIHVASSLPPIIEPDSAISVMSAVDKANNNLNFQREITATWTSGESVWATLNENKQKAKVSSKPQTYVTGSVVNNRLGTNFLYSFASRDDTIYEKTYAGSISEYIAFGASEERYEELGIDADECLLYLPVALSDFDALIPYTKDGVITYRAQFSAAIAEEIFLSFGFEKNLFAGFTEEFNFVRLVISFTLDNYGAVKGAEYTFYIDNNNVTSELNVSVNVLKSSIGNVTIPSDMTSGIVIDDKYLNQPSTAAFALEDASLMRAVGNEIYLIDQKSIGRYALVALNGDNLTVADYENLPDQFYVTNIYATSSEVYILGAQTEVVSGVPVKTYVLYRYDTVIRDIVESYELPFGFNSFCIYMFGNDRILYGVRNESVNNKLTSVNLSDLSVREYGEDTLQSSAKVTLYNDSLYVHGDGYSFFKVNLNLDNPTVGENYTSHLLKGANTIIVTADKIWGAGRVFRSSTLTEIVSDSSVCGIDGDGKVVSANEFYCNSSGIIFSDIGLVESVSRSAFLLLDNTDNLKGAVALSGGKAYYWTKSGTSFSLLGFENTTAKSLSFVGATDNDTPKEMPESIEIYSAEKTVYEIGELICPIYIKVNFSDERFQILPVESDMVSGFSSGSAGEKTAVISYFGQTANYDYTINSRYVSDIEIVDGSFKNSYEIRETLDLSSARLFVTFNNTQTVYVNIEESMVSGFDSQTDGAREITVTYAGLTATHAYSVSYTADTVTNIELKNPLSSVYYYQEDLPWENLILVVTYYQQEASEEYITLSMVSGFNTYSVGNKTMVISYEGLTITHQYLVCYKVTSVTVKADSFKDSYDYNETVDFSNAYFIVNYDKDVDSQEVSIDSSMATGFNTHQTAGSYDATLTYTAVDGNTYPVIHTYQVTEDPLGVQSIEIEDNSFSDYYFQGDILDLSNAFYTINHVNGSTTTGYILTEDLISGFDTLTLGTKTLTVTVDNVTATFDYTVVKKPTSILLKRGVDTVSSILATSYYKEQEITLSEIIADCTFALNFSDGTVSSYSALTEGMISGFSLSVKGHFYATISYSYLDATANLTQDLSLTQPYDVLAHAKTAVSVSVGMLIEGETPLYNGAFPESYTHMSSIDLSNAYLTINNFDGSVTYLAVNDAISGGSLTIRDFETLLDNYPQEGASIDFTYTDPYNDIDNVFDFSVPFSVTPADSTVVSLELLGNINEVSINSTPEFLIFSEIPKQTVESIDYLANISLVLISYNGAREEIPLELSLIAGLSTSVSGTHTATVTYSIYGSALSLDFDYYVRNVTEINYKNGDPFLSIYEVGDVIDLSGLTVVATTINGIGQTVYVDITYESGELSVSGADTSVVSSSSEIVITYSQKSVTHTYKVIKKISSIAFEEGTIKSRYYLNELDGISYPLNNKKVIITYEDLSEEALVFMVDGSAVTNFTISGALITDSMLMDSGSVSVTYLGKYTAQATYGVLPRITSVSVNEGSFKSEYYFEEIIPDLSDASLNLSYTTGSETYINYYSLPTSVSISETMLYFGSNVLSGLSAISSTAHGVNTLTVKYDYTEDTAKSLSANVSYNVLAVVTSITQSDTVTKFPTSFEWGTFTTYSISEIKDYQIIVYYSDSSSAYVNFGTEIGEGIIANVIFSLTAESEKNSPELIFSTDVGDHEAYVWYKDPLTNVYYNYKLLYTVNNTVDSITLSSTVTKYPHNADLTGIVITKMTIVYKDGSHSSPIDIYYTGAENVTVSGLVVSAVTTGETTLDATVTYTYKQGMSVDVTYQYTVKRIVSSINATAPMGGYNYKQFINAGVSVYEEENYGTVNVTYSTGETLSGVTALYSMLAGFSLETVGGFSGTITYQEDSFYYGGIYESDSASVSFDYNISAYDTGNYTVKYASGNQAYLFDHEPLNASAVNVLVTLIRNYSDGTTAEVTTQSSLTAIYVYEAFTEARFKTFLYPYQDRDGVTQSASINFFYIVKKVPVSIAFNESAFLGSYPNNTDYQTITDGLLTTDFLITYSDGSSSNPSSINLANITYDDSSSVIRSYTNSDGFTADVSFTQLDIRYAHEYVLADGTIASTPIYADKTVEILPANDLVIGISLSENSFLTDYEYLSDIEFTAGSEINVHYYDSTPYIHIYPCTGAVLDASSAISNYQITSGAVSAPSDYDSYLDKFFGTVTYEGFSVNFYYTVTATPVYSVDLTNMAIKGLICTDNHTHTEACYEDALSLIYLDDEVYAVKVTLEETVSGIRLKGTYADRAADNNTYVDVSSLVNLSREKLTVSGVTDYVNLSTNVYADFSGEETALYVNYSGTDYFVFDYVRAYSDYTPISFSLDSVNPAVTEGVDGNWYFKEGDSLSSYTAAITLDYYGGTQASYSVSLQDLISDFNPAASETVKTLTLSPVDILTQTKDYYVVSLPTAIYAVNNSVTIESFTENDIINMLTATEGENLSDTYSAMLLYSDGTLVKISLDQLDLCSDTLACLDYDTFINNNYAYMNIMVMAVTSTVNEISFTRYAEQTYIFVVPLAPVITELVGRNVYTVGEEFDIESYNLNVYFLDINDETDYLGEAQAIPFDIKAMMVSGFDTSIAGSYTLKISYKGINCTFDYTVNGDTAVFYDTVTEAAALPLNLGVMVGEAIDLSNIIVNIGSVSSSVDVYDLISVNISGTDYFGRGAIRKMTETVGTYSASLNYLTASLELNLTVTANTNTVRLLNEGIEVTSGSTVNVSLISGTTYKADGSGFLSGFVFEINGANTSADLTMYDENTNVLSYQGVSATLNFVYVAPYAVEFRLGDSVFYDMNSYSEDMGSLGYSRNLFNLYYVLTQANDIYKYSFRVYSSESVYFDVNVNSEMITTSLGNLGEAGERSVYINYATLPVTVSETVYQYVRIYSGETLCYSITEDTLNYFGNPLSLTVNQGETVDLSTFTVKVNSGSGETTYSLIDYIFFIYTGSGETKNIEDVKIDDGIWQYYEYAAGEMSAIGMIIEIDQNILNLKAQTVNTYTVTFTLFDKTVELNLTII